MAWNAVDRFWAARTRGDWDAVVAQLQRGVSITMLHENAELSRGEFATFLRVMHNDAETTVRRRIAGGGRQIAILATVARPKATYECAGFYDLREGRIEVVQELWLARGGSTMMDFV